MRTRKGGPGALGWVTAALWRRRTPFAEALVATTVANLLALGTSMFSMQVYDRVIPSEGHQTLWVLTVGVSLAVILEFLLRLLRGRMQERVASSIDQTLSRRFFERMLNVRMEARPPTVGTLASQIKGFELVRGC